MILPIGGVEYVAGRVAGPIIKPAINSVARAARGVKSLFRGKKVVGSTFNKVLPTQDWINPAKVAEYKALLQSGQKLPPIRAYRQSGKVYIEDGHHRSGNGHEA